MTQNEELKRAYRERLRTLKNQLEDKPDTNYLLGQIREIEATLKALETVEELQSTSGLPQDRRGEYQQHIMLATIQATVSEVNNIKVVVDRELARQEQLVRDEIRELKTDATLFQKMVSDSLNAFTNGMSGQISVLRRLVISTLVVLMLFIGILIAIGIR